MKFPPSTALLRVFHAVEAHSAHAVCTLNTHVS